MSLECCDDNFEQKFIISRLFLSLPTFSVHIYFKIFIFFFLCLLSSNQLDSFDMNSEIEKLIIKNEIKIETRHAS